MQDLFFYLSKLFWALVSPDHLLLLLTLLGVVLLYSGRSCGLWVSLSALGMLMVIAVFPLGNLLLAPLENRFAQPELPEKIAGIVVLGGGEEETLSGLHQQPHFSSAAERVMSIPVLMRRYPDAPVVITGGSASLIDQTYRGADVVADWVHQLGMGERLVVEREARNTHENALYSGRLVDKTDGPWLLVTSAFHMPRSVAIFRHQGWDVLPYPVDYRVGRNRPAMQFWRNMRDLSVGVREWIGIVAYYLTGKTTQLLPDKEPG